MAGATADLDPPLRVDWIPLAELRDDRPGRLGMTFLPGKRGASSRYPGLVYRRVLARDLATLSEAGVETLLLMVEDVELERWGDPDIVAQAAEAGVRIVRRPLADGSAPASPSEMDEVLALVADARTSGDVAVACMGGVGRTGMVVACALVAAGHASRSAISRVRQIRHPEAVETMEQVMFVDAYERHVAPPPPADRVAP